MYQFSQQSSNHYDFHVEINKGNKYFYDYSLSIMSCRQIIFFVMCWQFFPNQISSRISRCYCSPTFTNRTSPISFETAFKIFDILKIVHIGYSRIVFPRFRNPDQRRHFYGDNSTAKQIFYKQVVDL